MSPVSFHLPLCRSPNSSPECHQRIQFSLQGKVRPLLNRTQCITEPLLFCDPIRNFPLVRARNWRSGSDRLSRSSSNTAVTTTRPKQAVPRAGPAPRPRITMAMMRLLVLLVVLSACGRYATGQPRRRHRQFRGRHGQTRGGIDNLSGRMPAQVRWCTRDLHFCHRPLALPEYRPPWAQPEAYAAPDQQRRTKPSMQSFVGRGSSWDSLGITGVAIFASYVCHRFGRTSAGSGSPRTIRSVDEVAPRGALQLKGRSHSYASLRPSARGNFHCVSQSELNGRVLSVVVAISARTSRLGVALPRIRSPFTAARRNRASDRGFASARSSPLVCAL